jgi:hypothetical protein
MLDTTENLTHLVACPLVAAFELVLSQLCPTSLSGKKIKKGTSNNYQQEKQD